MWIGKGHHALPNKKSMLARLASPALIAGAMISMAPNAYAHDAVINSNPADRSQIAEFPRHIELEFSGIPKDSFNTVALSNQDTGEVLFTQTPKLDKQKVSVDVPAHINPGPGNYKVGFQITSSDGHATRGMTVFTVQGHTQPSGQKSDEPVVTSSESSYSPQTYLAVAISAIVAVGLISIGLIAWINKKRKK